MEFFHDRNVAEAKAPPKRGALTQADSRCAKLTPVISGSGGLGDYLLSVHTRNIKNLCQSLAGSPYEH